MSSTTQIQANRQNSLKSTGPRSAEGKAVVAKNAVKHGLFAHEAVITGENKEDYELFRDEFLAELAPIGAMESILAERIVSLTWRLQRTERIQNQVKSLREINSMYIYTIQKSSLSIAGTNYFKRESPCMKEVKVDSRGVTTTK